MPPWAHAEPQMSVQAIRSMGPEATGATSVGISL